ncbi:MAG TPA: hypothetical protein VLU73_16770, partial [Methylococcaceae bacterium]|nr:hypothetical protein [Methylococcaceae bacterium]
GWPIRRRRQGDEDYSQSRGAIPAGIAISFAKFGKPHDECGRSLKLRENRCGARCVKAPGKNLINRAETLKCDNKNPRKIVVESYLLHCPDLNRSCGLNGRFDNDSRRLEFQEWGNDHWPVAVGLTELVMERFGCALDKRQRRLRVSFDAEDKVRSAEEL